MCKQRSQLRHVGLSPRMVRMGKAERMRRRKLGVKTFYNGTEITKKKRKSWVGPK